MAVAYWGQGKVIVRGGRLGGSMAKPRCLILLSPSFHLLILSIAPPLALPPEEELASPFLSPCSNPCLSWLL